MNKYLNKVMSVIIERTGVDPEDISESSYFEDDLNISELELIEVLAALEEEYKIEFEEEEKEELESVMDLVELLIEKLD